MNYIICIRKSDTKWATVTKGSTLTNCCECDEPVWISPASVEVMLERSAKPLCIYCMENRPPPESIHPPSGEQLKEIIRELQKELKSENPTDRFKKQADR
jgi:hypothetical protein